MDAPAPAVRRACSCAWPMECSEMVDSCALGHTFVSFGCRDGSALRKVEFFEWMSLCGHNVGPRDKPTRTVEKMWQQCVGGTGILFRLSHFDHEDIVCGCGPAAAGSCGEQGVLLGTCPNPKLTRSMETRHRDSLRAVRDGQPKPPPRPTMRPGRPGVRSGSFAMWLGLTASESMSTSMTPEWRSTFTYASMKKPGWMHLLYQAGRLLRDVRPFFFASAIR